MEGRVGARLSGLSSWTAYNVRPCAARRPKGEHTPTRINSARIEEHGTRASSVAKNDQQCDEQPAARLYGMQRDSIGWDRMRWMGLVFFFIISQTAVDVPAGSRQARSMLIRWVRYRLHER